MTWEKDKLLYDGKAKKVYTVKGYDDLVLMEYKDNLTAFNGEKKSSLEDKGQVNRKIASFIFKYLRKKKIESHYVGDIAETSMVAKKVGIIPLEVVVRNYLAGSTAKKFALDEGTVIEKPLVEFFYKRDDLNDPFISDDQALMLEIATQSELDDLKVRALAVNTVLRELFDRAGIELIDFKLEFGRLSSGDLILADEISPDSCRLWNKETGEKMDKDRFRHGLGDVIENYKEVYRRILEVGGIENAEIQSEEAFR